MTRDRKNSSKPDALRKEAEDRCDQPPALLPGEPSRHSRSPAGEPRAGQGEAEGGKALTRAREELSRLQARYLDLYDFTPVSYLTLSPRGVILRANLTFAAMLRLERDALIEQPFSKLVDPRDRDTFALQLKQIVELRARRAFEVRLHPRNGPLLWARLQCIHIKGGEVENACTIRVVLSDVTEIKAAQERMRDNLELLDAVIESAAEGILVVDMAGRVLHVNRRFCTMWGIPEELMKRGGDKRLLPRALDQLTSPREFFARVRRLSRTADEVRETLHFRDGRIFDCSSLPLVKGGVISGRVWSFLDVTERRRIALALQESHDQLEMRVAARTGELAAAGLKMAKEIEERRQIEEELRQNKARLERQKAQLEELNTALMVILREKKSDRRNMEEQVVANIRQLVEPCVRKLAKSGLTGHQQNCLALLAENLAAVIAPFVRTVSAQALKLTPAEIQVASLIRKGKSSREIAELLNISPLTVNNHRRSVRKKLGISGKKKNLQSVLVTTENFPQ